MGEWECRAVWVEKDYGVERWLEKIESVQSSCVDVEARSNLHSGWSRLQRLYGVTTNISAYFRISDRTKARERWQRPSSRSLRCHTLIVYPVRLVPAVPDISARRIIICCRICNLEAFRSVFFIIGVVRLSFEDVDAGFKTARDGVVMVGSLAEAIHSEWMNGSKNIVGRIIHLSSCKKFRAHRRVNVNLFYGRNG